VSDVSFGFKVLCFGFPLQPDSPDPVIISDSHRDVLDDVAEIWWFYNKSFWPECVETKEKFFELHEIACFINDNAERFKRGHEAYISEKKALERQFEPLDERKKGLGGLLKRGELSQTEHQQRRKQLSLERNEIQEKIDSSYKQHVLSLFVDERCNYGWRDGLEEFIRNLD
jgi:hypothetical protein